MTKNKKYFHLFRKEAQRRNSIFFSTTKLGYQFFDAVSLNCVILKIPLELVNFPS